MVRAQAADQSTTGVKSLLAAARGNALIAGIVCGLVILFFGTAAATDWFGALSWEPGEIVVGCAKCKAVIGRSPDAAPHCPKCGVTNSLAPIVACKKCGHVYAYGPRGAGFRCPKCSAGSAVLVGKRSLAERQWKPPETADPKVGGDAND